MNEFMRTYRKLVVLNRRSKDNEIPLRDRVIKVAKDLNMEEYLTLKFWKSEENDALRT